MRRRLVDAAIEQLAEHGMRDLTHRKVERRAELAQGSAKYHFGTLDGLVEAVLERMVEIELASVMVVPPEVLVAADATGTIPDEVWQRARAACAEILSRPALVRARFELYLHAVGRPALQDIIRRGRERFVARTAAALRGDTRESGPGAASADSDTEGSADGITATHRADSESGARMVLALVDGMVLHHLSAPDQAHDDGAPLSTRSATGSSPERGAGGPVVERLALHLVATAAAARGLSALRAEPVTDT